MIIWCFSFFSNILLNSLILLLLFLKFFLAWFWLFITLFLYLMNINGIMNKSLELSQWIWGSRSPKGWCQLSRWLSWSSWSICDFILFIINSQQRRFSFIRISEHWSLFFRLASSIDSTISTFSSATTSFAIAFWDWICYRISFTGSKICIERIILIQFI